jgi:hypothetical protein
LEYQGRLDQIEASINRIRVPLTFFGEVYRLKEHVDLLIRSNNAYRCFCTPDRLDAMRKEQERGKKASKYDRTCLHLPPDEIRQKIESGLPYVVRMKIPELQTVAFDDLIRRYIQLNRPAEADFAKFGPPSNSLGPFSTSNGWVTNAFIATTSDFLNVASNSPSSAIQ